MPDYDVVITKTNVGDPTVLFEFSLTPSNPDNENQSIEDLTVEIVVADSSGNKISLPFNIPTMTTQGQPITLIAPFSIPTTEEPTTLSVEAIFSKENDSFHLNSSFQDNGDNSFTNNSVPVTPAGSESLGFVLPEAGGRKLVCVQCISSEGLYAFLTATDSSDSPPYKLVQDYISTNEKQNWFLRNIGGDRYTLKNGEIEVYVEVGNLGMVAPENFPESYVFYYQDPESKAYYYLTGNTDNGNVSPSLGSTPPTEVDTKSQVWHLMDGA